MKRRFISVCAIGLVLAAGLALGVARVRAQGSPPSSNPGQPLAAILDKLNQLIAAVPTDVTSKLDSILEYLEFFNGGNTVGAWSRTYSSSTRFVILSELNDEAFLDRETGLVWDRHGTVYHPGTFPQGNWTNPVRFCYSKTIGTRQGWRPATIEELSSLIGDLPPWQAGLLTGSLTSFTWSSTTVAGDPTKAWAVSPTSGSFRAGMFPKTDCCGTGVWCVRGGHGHDGQ